MGKDQKRAYFYNEDWDGSVKPWMTAVYARYAWCRMMQRVSPARAGEYARQAAKCRSVIDEAKKIRVNHRITQY